jgi:hypothetical protein
MGFMPLKLAVVMGFLPSELIITGFMPLELAVNHGCPAFKDKWYSWVSSLWSSQLFDGFKVMCFKPIEQFISHWFQAYKTGYKSTVLSV